MYMKCFTTYHNFFSRDDPPPNSICPRWFMTSSHKADVNLGNNECIKFNLVEINDLKAVCIS